MPSNDTALWIPPQADVIPASADGAEIARHVRALSKRDVQQMIDAYHAENYEMLSTFVWTKAMAALKRQLKSLGMEFIGEMLARPDVDANSAIEQCITDYEVVRLAEDLAMVNGTTAMRLRQALEAITHFAHSDSL